jgi:hypothetical protein
MADTFVVADILTFVDSIVQEFFNFYYCGIEASRHRGRARRRGFSRPPIQIIADINAASLLGSSDNWFYFFFSRHWTED